MLNRREFLVSAAGVPLLAAVQPPRPIRVVIITTVYRYLSHGQHIGDRFLVGYPIDGAWHKPAVQVVSLYVDQKPDGDLSQERAAEFGFKVYPTIAEALCCGGKQLACDAVLIVAEHGEYPSNEKGQKLYPRYEFFEQCLLYSGRASERFRCTTTSISPTASIEQRRWWLLRTGLDFPCWEVRPCR